MKDKVPSLNINEIYASVQGETTFSGLPTTFIRLSACNLRCSWCDTPYSFGRGDTTPLVDIIEHVKNHGCPYICITGGEPLLQRNVHQLMSELCDLGYQVSIETGGSLTTEDIDPRVTVILDIKCPGSDMSDKNFWANLKHLKNHDEVKFVLLDRTDYDYAVDICHKFALFQTNKSILFSPVHGELDPKTLIDWILNDRIPVRLNLQIHKYIWSPEKKGV